MIFAECGKGNQDERHNCCKFVLNLASLCSALNTTHLLVWLNISKTFKTRRDLKKMCNC